MLAVERLRDAGYQVNKIISLIDRQAGGSEFYASQGLEFESLFTLEDIKNN